MADCTWEKQKQIPLLLSNPAFRVNIKTLNPFPAEHIQTL